jgi:ketosteroid isomerase-like protein
MRARLGMWMISKNMSALRDGDPAPTLRMDADDVCLHFPGQNSWAGVHRGKEAVSAWLARFAEIGLQIYPDEVMVKGWPWKMTMSVRGRVFLHAPDGELVYDNRYVIWGVLRWGKLAEYEAYEDTQKSAALDEYLAAHPAA